MDKKAIQIIDMQSADEINNAYGVCECTRFYEGIEIPREEYNTFVRFKCPRCGKDLGVFVRGKNDNRYFNVI